MKYNLHLQLWNKSNDDFVISGYICKPEILRSNRNDINVFVNGRIVKNYDINKAINDAYYNYKPDKRYTGKLSVDNAVCVAV